MTIHQTLEKYFGYKTFRSGQEEIIKSIVNGKNVLAILPTGAGKSICFQIPALASDQVSIVISPLIALMKDQVDALNKIERTSAFINSSLDYREAQKVLNDAANKKIKLLYVSPEKLENQFFAEQLKNFQPKYLFIDEAHCISEWGHNFRPSYRKIKDLLKFIEFENVAAFTATATPEVRKDIVDQLDLNKPKIFVKGFERENLKLAVIKTKQKNDALSRILTKDALPAIIYTATRKQAETASDFLNKRGLKAQHYHAGLSNEVRRLIQDDFSNSRLQIIAATNAFGMGIDKEDIRTIVHYNIPGSIENYYQEIGRAGRDGKLSNIFLLFNDRDKQIHDFLINSSYPNRQQIETVYQLICDYGKIALGSVSDKSIEINKELSQKLNLAEINSSLLNSSLKILEESGYISIESNFKRSISIQFLVSTKQLRKFTESSKDERMIDLVLYLLRELGSSAFESRSKFNMAKLTEKIGVSQKECFEILNSLDAQGIIEYFKPTNNISISISSPRVKKENLRLNLTALQKQKSLAKTRLDEMINFAFARECRFRVILKYFGEEVNDYKCGKCDICLGSEEDFSISEFLETKILDTLNESFSPLSFKELSNILIGEENNEEFINISTFGSAAHFSEKNIKNALNNLIHLKKISKIEHGKYDIVNINLELESDHKPAKDNYEPYLRLFNRLREIRKETAGKFGQSPNLICSDEILRKIADEKPQSASALMSVKGFTQRMYNKVGEEFLIAINELVKSDSELDTLEKKNVPDTTKQILELVKKRYSLNDIASLTKLPEAVVSMQIESLISLFPDLIIDSLVEHKKASKILDTIHSGITNIKELKSSLSNDISYGEIRVILAKELSVDSKRV